MAMNDVASPKLRVFIDTMILKHARDRLDRLFPSEESVTWGGRTFPVTVYSFGTLLPNRRLPDEQYREAQLLRSIAELAKQGTLEILLGSEVFLESWNLPNMDGGNGRFHGAPVTMVDPPFQYGRVIAGYGAIPQADFVKSLKIPRLHELAIACGANQGKSVNSNQLLDAFHIYCAEAAGATHFLTMERKLIRLLARHRRFPPRVKVVLPSQLLAEVGQLPADLEEPC